MACCSTLLARALDKPGVSTVLREPAVLFHLANRLIRNADSANRQRVELVVRLLERPLAGGETVLVKPTNSSNRLVDVLLTLRPDSKAILLYSGLESFIQSLLMRHGEELSMVTGWIQAVASHLGAPLRPDYRD